MRLEQAIKVGVNVFTIHRVTSDTTQVYDIWGWGGTNEWILKALNGGVGTLPQNLPMPTPYIEASNVILRMVDSGEAPTLGIKEIRYEFNEANVLMMHYLGGTGTHKMKLSKFMLKLLPFDIPELTHTINVVCRFLCGQYDIGVLSGDEISQYYANIKKGSPIHSCMSGNPEDATSIYAKNDNVRMLTVSDKSRMLLFKDINGDWVADREYGDAGLRFVAMASMLTGEPLCGFHIKDTLHRNKYLTHYLKEYRSIKLRYDPHAVLPYIDNFRYVINVDTENEVFHLGTMACDTISELPDVSCYPVTDNYAGRYRRPSGVMTLGEFKKSCISDLIKDMVQMIALGNSVKITHDKNTVKLNMDSKTIAPTHCFMYRGKSYPVTYEQSLANIMDLCKGAVYDVWQRAGIDDIDVGYTYDLIAAACSLIPEEYDISTNDFRFVHEIRKWFGVDNGHSITARELYNRICFDDYCNIRPLGKKYVVLLLTMKYAILLSKCQIANLGEVPMTTNVLNINPATGEGYGVVNMANPDVMNQVFSDRIHTVWSRDHEMPGPTRTHAIGLVMEEANIISGVHNLSVMDIMFCHVSGSFFIPVWTNRDVAKKRGHVCQRSEMVEEAYILTPPMHVKDIQRSRISTSQAIDAAIENMILLNF